MITDIEKAITQKESFESISSKLATLINIACDNIDNTEGIVVPVRDLLINIIDNETDMVGYGYYDIQEQAVLGIRFLADANVILSLLKAKEAFDRKAKVIEALDQVRCNLHITGERTALQRNQAVFIDSDALERSEGARNFVREIALYSDRKPYLVVAETTDNLITELGVNLDGYLASRALTRDNFSEVIYASDPEFNSKISDIISELKLSGVDTIKLLAVGDMRMLAPWRELSRRHAIRILALLFNKQEADKLGAGTYIELQRGRITQNMDEYKRYEDIVRINA